MYSQDLDQNLLYILKAELDNYKKAYKGIERLHRHDRKISLCQNYVQNMT